jgi:hypothetical protein
MEDLHMRTQHVITSLLATCLALASVALAAPPGNSPPLRPPGTLPAPERIEVKPAMGVVGANVTLEATLTRDGAPVPGRALSFTIKGHGANINAGSATTDASGKARLQIKVPELAQESYELTALSIAGQQGSAVSGKAGMGVFKADVKLSIAEGKPKPGAKGKPKGDMNARLLRFSMNRLGDGAEVDRKVKVLLDGKPFEEARSNGSIKLPELPDVMAVGNWNVEVIFEGDGSYLSKTAKLTVPKKD